MLGCFAKVVATCSARSTWLASTLLLFVLLIAAAPATAQGYARAYANLPEDTNVLQVIGNSVRANTSPDGDIETTTQSRINAASLVYTRTFAQPFFGNSAGVGVVLPYSRTQSLNPATNTANTNVSGIGDISFTLDWNLYGAKAMAREEFANAPAKIYGGLHAIVTVPTGNYNPIRSVNPSSNRYAFKLTYNQSFPWNDGKTWLDFYFSNKLFSNNNAFLVNNTLSQRDQWGFEAHLSHNITPAVWAEVGAIWGGGGRTYINDIPQNSSQNNWKGVVGFGTKAWQGGMIIGAYTQTVYHDPTAPKVKQFTLVIMQVF